MALANNLQADAYQTFRPNGVHEDLALRAVKTLSGQGVDVALFKIEFVRLKWMVGGLYVIALPVAWPLIRIAFNTGAISPPD